ncbi:hypothetical protein EC844_11315 [Acinetobacter calcoaceticus]|uniref:Uncharacterized protein n=1 Tax=Acinetobacter calcoaceticus TaxID=471 RepID=A0A4R1XVY6_ACICA|nr:hypothetical protein EC844_11315 [Acinetobacter calcoaceticus]
MLIKKLKSNLLFFCTFAMVCSLKTYASTPRVDIVRMQQIAKNIIKMQIVDDLNYQKNYLELVYSMVGNSTDQEKIQHFLNPFPKDGIANHLREINSEGLNSKQRKDMLQVIDEEIKQSSDSFRTCRVLPGIRKINQEHFSVPIVCMKPVLNSSQIREFEDYINKLSKTDSVQHKIEYLKAKQRFLKQATLKPYQSDLQIYIEDKNTYRAAIDDDENFPNIFIDQRDNALIPPPKVQPIISH